MHVAEGDESGRSLRAEADFQMCLRPTLLHRESHGADLVVLWSRMITRTCFVASAIGWSCSSGNPSLTAEAY